MSLGQTQIDSNKRILRNKGENGLYRHLVGLGILRSVKVRNPELEMLNLSDNFFSAARSSGDMECFIIGKALRRAAHHIYWQFLRLNKDKERNARFLNVVK